MKGCHPEMFIMFLHKMRVDLLRISYFHYFNLQSEQPAVENALADSLLQPHAIENCQPSHLVMTTVCKSCGLMLSSN